MPEKYDEDKKGYASKIKKATRKSPPAPELKRYHTRAWEYRNLFNLFLIFSPNSKLYQVTKNEVLK